MAAIATGGLLTGALGMALASGVIGASDVPKAERDRIEAVVRDYILANPEIIPQAMQRLQSREVSAQIATRREAIETPFAGAWAGNPSGDATLVVYYDYACGFCRRSVADVDRLLETDKQLKVVYRELPILSEDSEKAALMSLAAARQGKFGAFYKALFSADGPSPQAIETAARKAGLDERAALQLAGSPELAREIERNIETARALQFGGTPAWVIGNRVLNGAVGYDELAAAIAEARKARAS